MRFRCEYPLTSTDPVLADLSPRLPSRRRTRRLIVPANFTGLAPPQWSCRLDTDRQHAQSVMTTCIRLRSRAKRFPGGGLGMALRYFALTNASKSAGSFCLSIW